jgi:hypothetical protein
MGQLRGLGVEIARQRRGDESQKGRGRPILEPAALGVYVAYAAAQYAYSQREILGRCPCTASVERSGLLPR